MSQGMPHDAETIHYNAVRNIIAARLEAEAPAMGPGKYGAPNLKGLLGKVDAVLDRMRPFIKTLTPAQYYPFVEVVMNLVDALDAKVNPEPAPEG